MRWSEAGFEVQVADDGIGFEPGTAAELDGNGLRNMQARAEEIGATLILASQPGKGTSVTLRLPRPGAAARDPRSP
jgi:signal transduction histidine kinase